MHKARVNGRSVGVHSVEVTLAGKQCAPRPAGFVVEHNPWVQLFDYQRAADRAEKRAARKALRKKKG